MVSVTNVSTGAVVSWSLPLSLLLHSPHSLHCTAALPFPVPTPTAPPSGSRNVERAWSKRGGAVEDVAPEGKPPQMPRKCPPDAGPWLPRPCQLVSPRLPPPWDLPSSWAGSRMACYTARPNHGRHGWPGPGSLATPSTGEARERNISVGRLRGRPESQLPWSEMARLRIFTTASAILSDTLRKRGRTDAPLPPQTARPTTAHSVPC